MKGLFDLSGYVTIVTGAAGGLGSEMVKALAAQGSDIVALDLVEPPFATEIEKDFNVKCLPVACDITKQDEIRAAVDNIIKKFGKIDALVNNAGLYGGLTMKPFQDITVEEWDKVFSINVKGTWQMTSAVVPYLKEKGGSIVNISSCSILQGVPLLCHYVASKGAVWAMTRTMANELGQYKIRVNSITPGYTLTQASMQLAGSPEDFNKNYQRNINDRSIQRGMMPNDVVGTVVFLVSDASAFITGQNINVDGGSVHY
ncbi:MAG: SDR family oxidoreductase [Tepidanaerobacteraceae bacterium]|jgi:NAD(P)-dependent dehydrogenase (short-subunit alcohol dehydrogenase family)|nr:SDR family oxidoreductase [Tepidanaerobacteraceae bacterium]